jgi:2-polyprenyl-3-methyl-5-hydroxy-6-metoxy-1,4-benzoquinol methylase
MSIAVTQESIVRYAWAMKHCRGKTVLDVGCGTGAGTAILHIVAGETTGIDCDPAAVEKAKHWLGPQFECRMLAEQAIGGGPLFGTVVCLDVLHEFFDRELALLQLLSLAELGGKVLISVPIDGGHTVAMWDEMVRSQVTTPQSLFLRFYQPLGGDVDEMSNCRIQYRTHSTIARSGQSLYVIGKPYYIQEV